MAFLTSSRAWRAGAAAATVFLVCSAVHAQSPDVGEKALKAAFLYNFTKFVAWPSSAFESPDGPFRVCVFAEPSFRRDIEGMLAGESVGGRPVRVVTPAVDDVRRCHVAYFGPSETDRAAQLLPRLQQQPVFTVGEGARFLTLGGHVAFVVEDDRVRFDVNKSAVDRTALTVSSKLLRVARHVRMGAPAPPRQS